MKKPKRIPKFKNEAAEREFWLKQDSVDYIAWSQVKQVRFPNLKSSAKLKP